MAEGEREELARAVEELHEPDRLMDLVLMHLRADDAPGDVVELVERGRTAVAAWLDE